VLRFGAGAVGGADTVLGELGAVSCGFSAVLTMEGLHAPAMMLRDYLRDVNNLSHSFLNLQNTSPSINL
jgi:hypothetical protein